MTELAKLVMKKQDSVRELVEAVREEGKQCLIIKKIIVAQYVADWIEPYKSEGSGVPIVITSNHPRFQPKTRFDYGFLKVALAQGYAVLILPTGKTMTESEKKIYGEAKPVE